MTEDELEKFGQKLQESMSFPGVYMFKFIVKSANRDIALVENLFEAGADILTKQSGRGNYTSVTAKMVVINVAEIMEIYRRAAKIPGIMFL